MAKNVPIKVTFEMMHKNILNINRSICCTALWRSLHTIWLY
jgi:hypothetical protein